MLCILYISYTSHLMIDNRYLKRQKEKGRVGMHKKWEKGRKKYRENIERKKKWKKKNERRSAKRIRFVKKRRRDSGEENKKGKLQNE